MAGHRSAPTRPRVPARDHSSARSLGTRGGKHRRQWVGRRGWGPRQPRGGLRSSRGIRFQRVPGIRGAGPGPRMRSTAGTLRSPAEVRGIRPSQSPVAGSSGRRDSAVTWRPPLRAQSPALLLACCGHGRVGVGNRPFRFGPLWLPSERQDGPTPGCETPKKARPRGPLLERRARWANSMFLSASRTDGVPSDDCGVRTPERA